MVDAIGIWLGIVAIFSVGFDGAVQALAISLVVI